MTGNTDRNKAARALIEPLIHYGNPKARGAGSPQNKLCAAAASAIATLADALEAERAKVAAAYEAAARDCALMADQVANAAITGPPEQARLRESMEAAFTKAAYRIRALTPADAQVALNKLLAEARLEGWRAGRDAAANEATLYDCSEGSDDFTIGIQTGYRDAVGQIVEGIRALPEPKETSHD